MDFRRLLASTTKPVLSSQRASSAHADSRHDHDFEAESDARKPSVGTMTSVLATVNKMKLISQRSLAAKGNVTRDTPLKKFDAVAVTKEVENVLKVALTDVEYEPKRARFMCKSLSETIKGKVKSMKFPRYKFVTMVSIGSKCDQSMVISSQCLWNTESDSYASAYYTNDKVAAVATVFAIFKE